MTHVSKNVITCSTERGAYPNQRGPRPVLSRVDPRNCVCVCFFSQKLPTAQSVKVAGEVRSVEIESHLWNTHRIVIIVIGIEILFASMNFTYTSDTSRWDAGEAYLQSLDDSG